MRKAEYYIDAELSEQRVDLAVSALSGLTRSQVSNLINNGSILVNSHPTKPNYKVREGDLVTVSIVHNEQVLRPENIPVEILYMDDFVLVVNKPPQMVVYPAAGHSSGTLINAVAYHAKKLASVGGPLRPGIVHRLDKDTSGVMIIALDDRAYYDLVEQFKERTINRRYKAVIFGSPRENSGEISLKIGRSESDRKKMSTRSKRGKEAVTNWKVIERFHNATLIEAKLGTGRTHQIRVHFASIGHPVAGDKTYGSKTSIESGRRKITFPRQMLHADLLGFVHPLTKDYMEFTSPMPEDMEVKIKELRAS